MLWIGWVYLALSGSQEVRFGGKFDFVSWETPLSARALDILFGGMLVFMLER